MIIKIYYLFFLLLIPLLSHSQEKAAPLKVGYTGSVPFVIGQDRPHGITIDVWREITYAMDYSNYKLIPYNSIDQGITAVQNKELDALIGPITITADRVSKVAFTQPYYDTGFALMAPELDMSLWERIKPFFSINFIYGVLGLLFILSIVGILVWLAERKAAPDAFSQHPVKGIGSGIWLALVTMTTVGYGDFAPKTILGRIVIGTWMIISLITATSFVAGIASTLTLTGSREKTITKINQLEGVKTATTGNSRLVDIIKSVGGKPVNITNVKEGYDMLINGEVQALIYDKVQLEYMYENNKKSDYVLTKNIAFTQHYGFAFREESDFKDKVDVSILNLKESGAVNQIVNKWLRPKSEDEE